MYVLVQLKQMLLSETICKGLGLLAKDFPNAPAQPEVAKCMATEDDKYHGIGCDCPTRMKASDLEV